MFQSPQWGSNSKNNTAGATPAEYEFQSPQWGSNSKTEEDMAYYLESSFSPRNGEVILKGQFPIWKIL